MRKPLGWTTQLQKPLRLHYSVQHLSSYLLLWGTMQNWEHRTQEVMSSLEWILQAENKNWTRRPSARSPRHIELPGLLLSQDNMGTFTTCPNNICNHSIYPVVCSPGCKVNVHLSGDCVLDQSEDGLDSRSAYNATELLKRACCTANHALTKGCDYACSNLKSNKKRRKEENMYIVKLRGN